MVDVCNVTASQHEANIRPAPGNADRFKSLLVLSLYDQVLKIYNNCFTLLLKLWHISSQTRCNAGFLGIGAHMGWKSIYPLFWDPGNTWGTLEQVNGKTSYPGTSLLWSFSVSTHYFSSISFFFISYFINSINTRKRLQNVIKESPVLEINMYLGTCSWVSVHGYIV